MLTLEVRKYEEIVSHIDLYEFKQGSLRSIPVIVTNGKQSTVVMIINNTIPDLNPESYQAHK